MELGSAKGLQIKFGRNLGMYSNLEPADKTTKVSNRILREIVSAVSNIGQKLERDIGFQKTLKTTITVVRNASTGEPTSMTSADLIDMFPSYWWLVASLQRLFLLKNITQGPMSDVASEVGRFMVRRQYLIFLFIFLLRHLILL
jgi:hypothetical protein